MLRRSFTTFDFQILIKVALQNLCGDGSLLVALHVLRQHALQCANLKDTLDLSW